MAKRKRRRVRIDARRPRIVPGTAPGTLRSPDGAVPAVPRVMAYGPGALVDENTADVARWKELRKTHQVIWLDIPGLGDSAVLNAVSAEFGLHLLAMEDVFNGQQRPKVEDYGDHVFVVLRVPILQEDGSWVAREVGLFAGQGWAVCLHSAVTADLFEPIRGRLQDAGARIRRSGADYLAYALIDLATDHLFAPIDHWADTLEVIEDQIIAKPSGEQVEVLHALRRRATELRRLASSKREAAAMLRRLDIPFITEETRVFIRDVEDHAQTVAEEVHTLREAAAALVDLHMTSVSSNTNEIMRVLTLIATVFIPLTFIAGIYGMNFDPEASPYNMPELGWELGYPAVWVVMLVVALGLLWLFRRRGWFG